MDRARFCAPGRPRRASIGLGMRGRKDRDTKSAMLLNMLKAKIHRATITMTDLHYEGSIAIDRDILDAAGILPYERVDIWNVTNGQRLATYAIEAARGSKEFMLNGAAARMAEPGDQVIIAAFGQVEAEMAANYKPTVVLMKSDNVIDKII